MNKESFKEVSVLMDGINTKTRELSNVQSVLKQNGVVGVRINGSWNLQLPIDAFKTYLEEKEQTLKKEIAALEKENTLIRDFCEKISGVDIDWNEITEGSPQ